MRIERVRLAGLGCFHEEQEIAFPDKGTAVIAGVNESGKTSLAWAIYGVFFGFPPRARVHLDEKAWVQVRFAARGKRFQIHRDFHTHALTFSELAGQKQTVLFEGHVHRAAEEEAYREALESRTALSEGMVWLQTGAVIEGEVETRLGRAVRSWLGMSAAGPETALTRLKARLARLNGHDSEHAGQVESAREELVRRREELVSREEQENEAFSLRERLARCEAERKDALKEAAATEGTLDTLRGFEELSRERSRMEEDLLRHRRDRDRIRQHVEEVENLEERLEKYFADFLDAPDDIEEIIQTYSECHQKLENRDREREQAQRALAALPVTHTTRNGGIAGAAAALFGWLGFLGAGAPAVGLILIPAFAGLGFGFVWRMGRNVKRTRLQRHMELSGLTTEISELRGQTEAARSGLGKLDRYRDPAQLRREARRYMQARSDLDRARSVRDSHPPLSEAVNSYEEVFTELQVLDTQIREMVASARYLSGLDASTERMAREFEKTRAKQEEARARAEALATEILSLEASIAKTSADPRHTPRLREEIALLESREQEMENAASALALAVEAMEGAIGAYHDADVDRLVARAGEHLSLFTRGAHDRVRWTLEMEPEVHTPDTGWHPAEQLGASARSQLHLALRLAVTQERPAEDSYPILLDGAFPGWDDDRLEAARAALSRLAGEGRQVIVLTADSRVACWERFPTRLEAGSVQTPHSRAA